jgi:hypothetical protein
LLRKLDFSGFKLLETDEHRQRTRPFVRKVAGSLDEPTAQNTTSRAKIKDTNSTNGVSRKGLATGCRLPAIGFRLDTSFRLKFAWISSVLFV